MYLKNTVHDISGICHLRPEFNLRISGRQVALYFKTHNTIVDWFSVIYENVM